MTGGSCCSCRLHCTERACYVGGLVLQHCRGRGPCMQDRAVASGPAAAAASREAPVLVVIHSSLDLRSALLSTVVFRRLMGRVLCCVLCHAVVVAVTLPAHGNRLLTLVVDGIASPPSRLCSLTMHVATPGIATAACCCAAHARLRTHATHMLTGCE